MEKEYCAPDYDSNDEICQCKKTNIIFCCEQVVDRMVNILILSFCGGVMLYLLLALQHAYLEMINDSRIMKSIERMEHDHRMLRNAYLRPY